MLGIAPRRFVFIDETWASTNMVRRYGRALCGTRLVEAVPCGHWKTTTFLAGLRLAGLTAPLVIDGPINGELFLAYVRQHLRPMLRPDDIVVMDNLSSHKVAGVGATIEAASARLVYLPPYSPDFKPIEQLFAKFKWLLRSAAERTIEALWQTIGRLLDRFSPQECRAYFRHSGYSATPE